jgi:hypothetical protein
MSRDSFAVSSFRMESGGACPETGSIVAFRNGAFIDPSTSGFSDGSARK